MCTADYSLGPTYTSSSVIAETALQGELIIAKSGRRELRDNILRTLQVYLQPLRRTDYRGMGGLNKSVYFIVTYSQNIDIDIE